MVRPSAAAVLVGALLLGGCSILDPIPGYLPTTVTIATPARTTAAPSESGQASRAPGSAVASGPATPATSPPASSTAPAPESSEPTITPGRPVVATDQLGTAGLGPLTLGMAVTTLQERGYITRTTGNGCYAWESSPALAELGVALHVFPDDTTLTEIAVTTPTIKTKSGATVGMTVARIKQIYGTRAVSETKTGNGVAFPVLSVKDGSREVTFIIGTQSSRVSDSDTITSIVARTSTSKEIAGTC